MGKLSRILLAACAAAAWVLPARADSGLSLSLDDQGEGACLVEGSFVVEASSRVAWSVLSDYDGLDRFVSSMERSKVRAREAEGLLVEQLAVAKVLMFKRRVRVLLRVKEDPLRSIRFKDLSGEDFLEYEGGWTLEPDPAGLRVSYRLQAKRNFAAPSFLAKRIFKDSAASLLQQVREEILRRARSSPEDRPHEGPTSFLPEARRPLSGPGPA